MSKKIKMSIIIPIFNSEKYLSRCIRSVRKIKNTNIEIILVNDGSVDNSEEICKQNAKEDERIVILNQINMGVSAARNAGIRKASGEWIAFVDSDDEVCPQVYEKSIDLLQDSMDMLILLSQKVVGNEKKETTRLNLLDLIYNKKDIEIIRSGIIDNDLNKFKTYQNTGLVFSTPWAKFYRRKIILDNNIKFCENISFAEDKMFNFLYLAYIDHINCRMEEGYFYYQNNNSAMNSYKNGKSEALVESIKNWRNIASDYDMEIAQFGIRQYLYALKLDFCHLENKKSYAERKKEALLLRDSGEVRRCFDEGKIKNLRPAALMLGIGAKYRIFRICDLMLKVKEVLKIQVK